MTAADLDLEALREVVENGTPGPWDAVGYYIRRPDGFAIALANQRDDNSPTDAALIVAAVNALPVLIEAVEEARGKAAEWKQAAYSHASCDTTAPVPDMPICTRCWQMVAVNGACGCDQA